MARKQTGRNDNNRMENNPANKMDAKGSDNQFPGYPHYSSKEDIMNGKGNGERVNVDVENLPSFHNATTPHRLNQVDGNASNGSTPTGERRNDLGIEMGTEADVTPEERKMLDDDMYYPTQDEDNLRQARLDDTDFDGEKLNEESFGAGQAESGSDLDMDAEPEAITNEALGEGDEENQYWSLSDNNTEETS